MFQETRTQNSKPGENSNTALDATQRTANTEPAKDPKLKDITKAQEELEYIIKLNRASLDEKTEMAQKRIKALDEDAPDYLNRLKHESELLQKSTEKPLSHAEIKALEGKLADSRELSSTALSVLKSAYKDLKDGATDLAEFNFQLADKHLDKALKLLNSEPEKKDPLTEEIAKMHDSAIKDPRTKNTDPEKDPKLNYVKKAQEELEFIIKLNRAPLEEKIEMSKKRINALDDNAPDYLTRLKQESDLLQKATADPLPKDELTKLEEKLGSSKKSSIAASTLIKDCYANLKEGATDVAEFNFKLADKHLEKALTIIHKQQ